MWCVCGEFERGGCLTFGNAQLDAALSALGGGAVQRVVAVGVSLLSTPVLEHAIVVVFVGGLEEVGHLEAVEDILGNEDAPGALDFDGVVVVDANDVDTSSGEISADASLQEDRFLAETSGVAESATSISEPRSKLTS